VEIAITYFEVWYYLRISLERLEETHGKPSVREADSDSNLDIQIQSRNANHLTVTSGTDYYWFNFEYLK
jgi:hypothetical protein